MAIWSLQTTLDKKSTTPGEIVHVTYTIHNLLNVPIYIGRYGWNTKFYSIDKSVISNADKYIPVGCHEIIGTGEIKIPLVPMSHYEIEIYLQTFSYNQAENNWTNHGLITVSQPQTIYVNHSPKYTAFISRSLDIKDRPLSDFACNSIQDWGFDTNTVGINKFTEPNEDVDQRIIKEIESSDCLIAIATPRDISLITNLIKTFAWLHSEVSVAHVLKKPLLIFADKNICKDGILNSVDVVPYDPQDLSELQGLINLYMPIMREAIAKHKSSILAKAIQQHNKNVALGAFYAGLEYGKLLPNCS